MPAPTSSSTRLSRVSSALAPIEVRALLGLLAAGAILRLVLTYLWRPGMLGFSDSLPYLVASKGSFFSDPLRPPGYPMVLWTLRQLSDELTFAVLAQHGMGLVGAVVAFLAVRRITDARWVPLVPAAVLALHGTQIWLEHSILTEASYTLVMLVSLYGGIAACDDRLAPGRRLAWAAGTGVALGFSVMIRPPGLALVPVFAVVLLFGAAGPRRTRAGLAATLGIAAVAVVLGALQWGEQQTGTASLARSADLAIYGRVAPFVDCRGFTPPEGTARLCPRTPVRDRLGPNSFLFAEGSPLLKAYGFLYLDDRPADASAKVRSFVLAAIRAQPGDYLEAVGRDVVRIVDPEFPTSVNPTIANQGAGYSPRELDRQLTDTANERRAVVYAETLYSTAGTNHKAMGFMRSYERRTQLTGVPMVLLLLLAAAAPFAGQAPRARAAAWLFTLSAFALLVVPILTLEYDWRYVVPALGPLCAAAALTLDALARRVMVSRSRGSARASTAPRTRPAS